VARQPHPHLTDLTIQSFNIPSFLITAKRPSVVGRLCEERPSLPRRYQTFEPLAKQNTAINENCFEPHLGLQLLSVVRTDPFSPDDYRAASAGGEVDMSGYHRASEVGPACSFTGYPGAIPFDFGWPTTGGRWIHANNADSERSPMEVYIDLWKAPYPGFDRKVYCVMCSRNTLKEVAK
jgi:hypothetical protein